MADNSEEMDLHTPENELEAFTMNVRKKWKNLTKRASITGTSSPEMTTEQKKVSDLADIIKTYRHVDEEKEDDHIDVIWVDSTYFDLFISSVIVLNTILIGVELDAEHNDGSRDWGWIVLEVLFMLTFMFEVYIKIKYHTWIWMFMDRWNMFTTFIAFMAFVDGVILQALGLHGSLRMLSLLRVLGMVRLLRVIRSFKSLKELRLVMQGLVGSLGMLIWTVIILIVFLYIAAVFTTSTIGLSGDFDEIKVFTNGFDHDDLFGTVGRSMYTLLQMMTRDGWTSKIARFVMIRQWYMSFFFLTFGMISTYGLLNLVVSVIVEQTLTAARSNESRAQAKEERSKRAELDGLKEIFVLADEDGSNSLNVDEFLASMRNEDILWKMRSLDLPIDDAARLFSVIDGEGSRELTLEEFIDGCTKLKGTARSRDLLAVTAQADTLAKKMDLFAEELQDCEKMLHALDEISFRITDRFHPAVKSSKKKIIKAVGGSAPVVPMHPEKPGSTIGIDLGAGNRPLLPMFPNLLN
jgi:voltage-gated sodium channel